MKRNSFRTLRIVLTALFLFAAGAVPASAEPPAFVAVEVRGGAVFIQGQPVTRKTTLAQCEAILGKPDRAWKNQHSTIHTYDKLGVLVYQLPNEETVNSITLPLKIGEFRFSPKVPFQGLVIIDDRVVRSDFRQAALPTFTSLRVDATPFPLPTTVTHQQEVTLIFDFSKSREKFECFNISWKE
jgi:hypothetical protein